jgi:CopG family transcriptional regulator, nickel-responsive regulator
VPGAAFGCMIDRVMAELVRIGVSLDGDLLERFDALLEDRGVANRSEAFRDLIRDCLVEAELGEDVEVVGSLTIIFDHRKRELSKGLTSVQHAHGHHVVSSLHVHVDETHCLEVIVLKGHLGEVKRLADQMLRTKGVLHGKLVVTSVGAITGHAHEE